MYGHNLFERNVFSDHYLYYRKKVGKQIIVEIKTIISIHFNSIKLNLARAEVLFFKRSYLSLLKPMFLSLLLFNLYIIKPESIAYLN